jgi:hypothetical protein
MRALTLTVLAALSAATPAAAQAPSTACLAPAAAQDGPVAFRDVKFAVYEAAVPGGAATARQSVVSMQACLMVTGDAPAYAVSYLPAIYTTDGHMLHAGNAAFIKVVADDPKGGPAHAVITESFSVGYLIDRAKLARSLTVSGLRAGPCTATADGRCQPLPADLPMRRVTVPACLADGSVPPPAECPAAAK